MKVVPYVPAAFTPPQSNALLESFRRMSCYKRCILFLGEGGKRVIPRDFEFYVTTFRITLSVPFSEVV
jgi:hypothetical protein